MIMKIVMEEHEAKYAQRLLSVGEPTESIAIIRYLICPVVNDWC